MEPEAIKVAAEPKLDGRLSRRTLLTGVAVAVAAGAGISIIEPALPVAANAAWGGYANGQIPLSALDVVSYPGVIPYQYSSAALPYVYLVSGCSGRLLQMLQKYHDTVGGYLRVAEGYRTLAGQQYWADKGGGPVGQSNHGWGEAVDFDKGSLTSAQANWLAANGPDYFFFPLSGDYGHYNYNGPITPGGDMPTLISATRSIPGQAAQLLPQMSWATLEAGTAWPASSVLIYDTTTATNPAELAPGATVFDFDISLYVSNLPAGEVVGVRMGLQNKSTGAISGLGSMTFGDSNSGKARGQYTGQLSINQSTYRAVIQAYSSAAGVSLDTLATSALAW